MLCISDWFLVQVMLLVVVWTGLALSLTLQPLRTPVVEESPLRSQKLSAITKSHRRTPQTPMATRFPLRSQQMMVVADSPTKSQQAKLATKLNLKIPLTPVCTMSPRTAVVLESALKTPDRSQRTAVGAESDHKGPWTQAAKLLLRRQQMSVVTESPLKSRGMPVAAFMQKQPPQLGLRLKDVRHRLNSRQIRKIKKAAERLRKQNARAANKNKAVKKTRCIIRTSSVTTMEGTCILMGGFCRIPGPGGKGSLFSDQVNPRWL